MRRRNLVSHGFFLPTIVSSRAAGRSPLRLLTVAAVLLLVACGDGHRNEPFTVDTMPGGAIRVVNHRPAGWSSLDSAWRFVLEREIAPAEGSAGEIGSVQSVALLGDGRIATMELSPARLRLYDSDGQWLRDIGGDGDGPGEFRDGEMVAIGDTLIVHDPSNSRLALFDTDGTSLTFHRCDCAMYHDLLLLENGMLGVPGSSDDGRGAWQVTDPATGRVSHTIPFPSGPPVSDAAQWRASRKVGDRTLALSRNIPNYPVFRWAILPDGSLVYGMNDSYRLFLGATEGDTSRIITSPAGALELTSAERGALYEAEIATVPAPWREAIRAAGSASDIPARVPPWASITGLPDGSVMVRLPRSGDSPFAADIIDSRGVLLGRVAVPDGLLGAGGSWHTSGDTIRRIARSQDEAGLPVVRIWRLERSTTAPR